MWVFRARSDKFIMLESLLYPESIAVIGASAKQGKVGYAVMSGLQESGFEGKIVPINPKGGEILGLKSYTSLEEYGEKVELSVIAVPTPAVKDAVSASIRQGVKSIIVITAGFKEVNEEGALLEKELARMCKQNNVRLLGPNVLGIINTHHKMNASFASQMPLPGGISIISQSGALCTAILDWAKGRHLGLGKLISIGNKADLDETDFLQVLAQDEKTHVVAGYLESIENGEEFLATAMDTCSIKPVVILKVGTTQAGAKAASSHTGSLAGGDIAYGAAFKRSGVIRAENFEELFDYATALYMQPLPQGERVAIITNAGGPGIMAADACERTGLVVSRLSESTMDELRKTLPAAASAINPIDVLGDADPERYAAAITAAQADEAIDAIIVILTPQAMTKPLETAEAVARCASQREKPVLAAFMGGSDVIPGREFLTKCNLPDYPSPERAANTLRAMCDYAAWRRRPPRVVTRFPVNRRRVERIISRHTRAGISQMGEAKGKEILRAYDFNVPDGRLVTGAEQAVEYAERFGYPVAMKIVSPDIVHKSDVGGVKVNLYSGQAVQDAFDLMMLRVKRSYPEARIEGVYLEKMCPPGREIILGMSRDPLFGPMLMFGLGGIFVEVMKDITFHLAPITHDEAMQMLRETRSYALLEGARGQVRVNLDAIAGGLQRISQIGTDFPQIQELDINPFIVGPEGADAWVADARMTVAKKKADKQ
jgi:acetyl coenzyme A synthetase (ADP forming)-like protein